MTMNLEASHRVFFKPTPLATRGVRSPVVAIAGAAGALFNKAANEVAEMRDLPAEQFQRRSFKLVTSIATWTGATAYVATFVAVCEGTLLIGALSSGLFGLAALATLILAIYGLYRVANFKNELQRLAPQGAVQFLLDQVDAPNEKEAARKLQQLRTKTTHYAVELILKQGPDALADSDKAEELIRVVVRESNKKMALYAIGAIAALLSVVGALCTLLLAASPAGLILGLVAFTINVSMLLLSYTHRLAPPHGGGAGPTSAKDATLPSRETHKPSSLPEGVLDRSPHRDRGPGRLRALPVH